MAPGRPFASVGAGTGPSRKPGAAIGDSSAPVIPSRMTEVVPPVVVTAAATATLSGVATSVMIAVSVGDVSPVPLGVLGTPLRAVPDGSISHSLVDGGVGLFSGD